MKVSGKLWNAYLDSWPDGWWFDESDETINGIHNGAPDCPKTIGDDDLIEITQGVVFNGPDDGEGFDFCRHFKKWIAAQNTVEIFTTVPKEREGEFRELIKSFLATKK